MPNLPNGKERGGGLPELLQLLDTPSRPWVVVSVDFITDLPPIRGKMIILAIVDFFSNQAHFVACNQIPTAKQLAKLYMQHIVRLHSFPDKVISDMVSQFVAMFWWEFLKQMGIEQGLSSRYHPETDGEMEWVNQILEQFIQRYINYQQDNRMEFLS